jgi:hypothetical protein
MRVSWVKSKDAYIADLLCQTSSQEAMIKRVIASLIIATVIIFSSVVSQAAQTLPFTDTANRPANINPNTVITTTNNGMWIVTDGSYYAGSQVTESVYVYQDGLVTKMSFLTSGFTCSVAKMPDPAPIVATTSRPANMNPDTILLLSNGQVLKITAGSYYDSSIKTEQVILYLSDSTYFLSFQTSGVAMQVEILTDTSTTYSLTVSVVDVGEVHGYGINCGNDCNEALKAGAYIKLTGSSSPHSWTGCESSSGATCYLTMDANKTVTVDFTLNPPTTYTLTVNKTGAGTGTVGGAGTYTEGAIQTITAIASTGSTFAGWSGNADCSDGSVTMDANKTCIATFTLNPPTPPPNKNSITPILLLLLNGK